MASPARLRLLGLVTVLASPAILAEALRLDYQLTARSDALGAVLYALFAIGWIAALAGLLELRATGRGRFGRALLVVPIVTAAFAFGQSVGDLLGVAETNPLYVATDLAWPLSMVLTFVASVAVLFAPALRGWHRWVPLYCGITLPLSVAIAIATGSEPPVWVFAWHSATGWALLGWVVYANARRSAPNPSSATTVPVGA